MAYNRKNSKSWREGTDGLRILNKSEPFSVQYASLHTTLGDKKETARTTLHELFKPYVPLVYLVRREH